LFLVACGSIYFLRNYLFFSEQTLYVHSTFSSKIDADNFKDFLTKEGLKTDYETLITPKIVQKGYFIYSEFYGEKAMTDAENISELLEKKNIDSKIVTVDEKNVLLILTRDFDERGKFKRYQSFLNVILRNKFFTNKSDAEKLLEDADFKDFVKFHLDSFSFYAGETIVYKFKLQLTSKDRLNKIEDHLKSKQYNVETESGKVK